MKKADWIKLILINLLFILVIISPFLPGPPNKLVIGLSVAGQSAGFFGLLLIPVGMIWAFFEIKRLRSNDVSVDWKPPYMLAITATVIVIAICFVLIFGLFIMEEFFVGLSSVVLAALGLRMAIQGIRKMKRSAGRELNPIPLYLLTIPLISLVTGMYVVEPLSNYSRNFAIERSQTLIASIEDYKNNEGVYPESLQDLEAEYPGEIPSPFIMGVLNFRYNKIDDHYSLSFSQWLEWGSLEQIVLYDKYDLKNNLAGKYANYDYGFDLCRVKGAFANYSAGYEDWQYYQCD